MKNFIMRCMTKPQQGCGSMMSPNDDPMAVRGICTHPNPTPNSRTLYHAVHDKAAARLRLNDTMKIPDEGRYDV
jgi:hypothetical protein